MQALASVLKDTDGLDMGDGDGAFPTILEGNENNNAFASLTASSTTTTTDSTGSGSDKTLSQGARAKWQFGAPCPIHLRIWQQLQTETGNTCCQTISYMLSRHIFLGRRLSLVVLTHRTRRFLKCSTTDYLISFFIYSQHFVLL